MAALTFCARVAYAAQEEDYYLVAFADQAEDYENYLILQGAFAYDEQDIKLGMDGEYLELNGPENSGYKRCRSAVLTPTQFMLQIEAAGSPDRVEIQLAEVEITEQLRQYLREILGTKLQIQE